MYDLILKQLDKKQNPIDVIVVGLGFMGFGFVSVARTLKNLRRFSSKGWKKSQLTVALVSKTF